jgi:hypothetical protein
MTTLFLNVKNKGVGERFIKSYRAADPGIQRRNGENNDGV